MSEIADRPSAPSPKAGVRRHRVQRGAAIVLCLLGLVLVAVLVVMALASPLMRWARR